MVTGPLAFNSRMEFPRVNAAARAAEELTTTDIREEHDSARAILATALQADGRNYDGLSLPVLARCAADTLATPITIWVATEFSIDDGGRAWIQAATTPELAKRLCVEHLNRNGDPSQTAHPGLVRRPVRKYMFGQTTEVARVSPDALDHYEIRRVEVESR